jgi:putative transport protein
MLDALRALLESSQLLAVFLAIGLGYALGQVNIKGLSLGVGAVLFTGLAIGAFAPGAAPPAVVRDIGLVMFLYGVGIQYGRQFVDGLRGPGRAYNALALTAVLAGLAVAVGGARVMGLSLAYGLGVFAGALTNTPALQAAMAATGSGEPAVGYSVAYPFGVIGPILCFYAMHRLAKPRVTPPDYALATVDITVEDGPAAGLTAGAIMMQLPPDVRLAGVRQKHQNLLPDPSLIIRAGDGLLLVGEADGLEQARAFLGRYDPGRLRRDRRNLDSVRVFVSQAGLIGVPLAELDMPRGFPAFISLVRRGDRDLLPSPDLVLEYGDSVEVLAPPDHLADVRRHFGDSMKATAEFSYISTGLGMALGVLLGMVKVPLPGLGTVSLGLAGGVLVVALILGYVGRSRNLGWMLPLSANLTLRTFGLTLFLASVGILSGPAFAQTILTPTGLRLFALGVAVLLATVSLVLGIGWRLMRVPFDDLLGVGAGATGNPAILVYASRLMQTERPDVAYAMIFPAMTLAKILAVQLLVALTS